jgi:NAD-dependent SIR2 family protein deacetylase
MMHTRCLHCDTPVTTDFARVFGDNRRAVHRCPACTEMRRLFHGEGAGLPVPVQFAD